MKVCFLVGTLGRGGAEKQLIFMLRALRQAGIGAKVLCLTKGEACEAEIEALGVPVEWVGAAQNRAARLLKIVGSLRKTVADIVQSSHFYTNIYAGLAGKVLRIPSIGAIRSDLTSEIKLHKFLGRWQMVLPRFLVVNSKLAHQRAITRGIAPRNIELVRNAVEIGTLPKSPTQNSTVKILFAGRLDKNKRPDCFVRLASILLKRFPHLSLQFQIAGDGELRTQLEKSAAALNLTADQLKFLGVCPVMSEVYEQADLLISTSEREGTSNVVLEAMAHGLPVIATDVGGTPEILNAERGFLIAPNDENALVSAAAELITNRELRVRLGSAGRGYVAENHSLASLEKQLTGIYERLT